MKLEELAAGQAITGLDPSSVATLIAVIAVADGTVQAVYKTPDGSLKERLLGRLDESNIQIAVTELPWAFDGDGDVFKLTVEAKRIELAFLFDPMMAVHTSNVQPLPHQITAVYESMLPRQPLRFILADDPGAGKTIMAGLYIRELIMRADAERILIVAPGSLVEQWSQELFEKFGLTFQIHSKAAESLSPSGNPFENKNLLIVRLDQLSRDVDLQEKLGATPWDLVIFDEAHKLSAHFYGQELKRTRRYAFAEKIGQKTRNLLLMTATPHNGKEEDYQLFLALLDADRFLGKFRDGVHKVDASDLMRRMVKEEIVKFDGTPLFPERKAYTVNYTLSDQESALYQAVTDYVKTEMGKADNLDAQRKGSVGFALTILQRRLASSPEAIYQSLKRRREKMERKLHEEKNAIAFRNEISNSYPLPDVPDDDEELNADEQEEIEVEFVDQATASRTVSELEAEIQFLKILEPQALAVVNSGLDKKWDELSGIMQNNPHLRDVDGKLRKIIIFTEHRDTLHYLFRKITGLLGNEKSVATIHGGTDREDRLRIQTEFRSFPEVRVLLATDAAGEGVNLQTANLMVNYDLPWNPNRLEQRFGRIHRIGQEEVCHLWSLVAKDTREGEVYHRLLEKLEVESAALQGRVFDILGEVFEEKSLKDLLIEAIRYGDQPEVRARLSQRIENALDPEHIRALLDRNALAKETMTFDQLFRVKEAMEKAEARRLQPYFVRSFFMKAFDTLGGSIHPRETGRFQITHVPVTIRERDRGIFGRRRRELAPVVAQYERICFTRDVIRVQERPGLPQATLLHPGHPLLMAMSDLLLEKHANLLRQGALMVDPADDEEEPHLLFMLLHEVKAGEGEVISKRLQFIRVTPDGKAYFAGWAPHLDLQSISNEDKSLLGGVLKSPWIHADQEKRALALAMETLVPDHFREVAERRIAHADKTWNAVHERLSKEISYWTEKYINLDKRKNNPDAGPEVRANLENTRRRISDLEGRLENRRKEHKTMRHVVAATPIAIGGALVIPAGLLRKLRGSTEVEAKGSFFSSDPEARKRIELLAMQAVQQVEESRGCKVVDVSAQKCGWDLTSYPPAVEGRQPEVRHIEVKGRVKGASTITVTRNEILYALNQREKFLLAIVIVDGEICDGPHYLKSPFTQEPDWAVTSLNLDLNELLKNSEVVC